jgi:uncharacterized protein DUF1360
VTSAVRAPFTDFQDDTGHGEVDEQARGGTGLRLAVDELLVCPNCLGQWVAGASTAGVIGVARATRAVAAMFTIHAGADALQLLHAATQDERG